MAKITNISADSPLKGLLKVGDNIIKFDGRDFVDILDYIYADSKTEGAISVKDTDGERVVIYQKQDENISLGLEFDDSVEITPKECHNNCIFCFVKQLPKNLRETLYIKDDDYLLSFISGCYITCTNLSEADIQRIIDYKLSPLYISVHATDEEVRKFMLGIKRTPNQMDIIRRLTASGIKIHSQIVLVGGINDGEVLQKSLEDLYRAKVSTVAIVPVGLTKWREGLYDIAPLTKEQARAAIKITEDYYSLHEYFCYCSDEMYQIAKKELPGEAYYGNYDQIENGVGLVAKFLSEVKLALELLPKNTYRKKRKVGVFTGISGESTIKKARELIKTKFPNIILNIYPVKNMFFGETVTVTGLITATDIINSYKNTKFTEKYIMIPSVMLREFQTVFLDNKSVKELSKQLRKKIIVTSPTGSSFLAGLTGRKND
ncbi:DUF512 domain-containing protein [bacterium]|nr:DUF512 domain-containing protein [bacterium]